jgi:outer membrane protein assembly factor BamB/tetratricopeptide (TPR) repeat protein
VVDDGSGGLTYTSAITFPRDRRAQQIMNKGAELIAEKEWAKAARELQFLLNRPEDGFVQITRDEPGKKSVPVWVSIRAEASQLIGTMDAEGLEVYERLYGAEATRMLDDALKNNDRGTMAEVAGRYLHTKAGAKAAELLGTRCLERDEPLMAALYFERLLARRNADKPSPNLLMKAALASYRAGDKAGGDHLWSQLKERAQLDGGLKLNGQLVSLDKVRDELDVAWTGETQTARDWPVYRGAPNRTVQGSGGTPFLEPVWEQTTLPRTDIDPPADKRNLEAARTWVDGFLTNGISFAEQRQQAIIPAFHPVAVGSKVLYRTYDGVYLADLKKLDKPEWWNHIDGGALKIVSDQGKKGQVDQWSANYGQFGPRTVLFENSVIGTLSTDGNRAFAVDDLILPPHPQYMRMFMNGGQPNFGAVNDLVNRNTLKCFNIESGKLMWELGGRSDKTDLADSFFLGAPLPLAGRLYVLNEKETELRLVCLEPKDSVTDVKPPPPTVVWTQKLATTKDKIQFDFNRRIHAAHLAYADGILVCPTNAGAVLGVDLLTHSLVWAHSYREGGEGKGEGKGPGPIAPGFKNIDMMGGMPMSSLTNEWKVSAPAVQDGKVVFTAPDGTAVHCLNLRDGRLVWRANRGADDLYFAGVFHGKTLIVSKNSVRALNLADGKEVWRLDNTGVPSGQGTASDNVYFLPIRAAADSKEPEVCSIDIDKGLVIAHTKSRKRDGKMEVPGNLFFLDGQVVSQSIDRVVSYPQLKAKLATIDKLLAQNPNDPVGLTERGELRLDQGEHKGAIDDLHDALRILGPNPAGDQATLAAKARVKLYDTLTEYFQKDFNQAERYLEEYRELCRSDNAEEHLKRQGNFLCLVAKGRESQGRLVEAFQAYRDFGKLAGKRELISVIDQPNTKSRPDVWARGRINAMMANASPDQRRPLEDKIAEEWKGLHDTGDIDALRDFISLFGSAFTVGKQAKLRLADKLIAENKEEGLREAQLLLLQLRELRGSEPEMAARAVDALARLNLQKGILEHAVHYYRELGRDFGTVIVRDGKTGADIWNDLATDRRFLPFLEGARQSWNGKWKTSAPGGQNQPQPAFTLEPVGELLPLFQRHRLVLETNTQRLRLIDQFTGEDKLPPNTTLGTAVQYIMNQGHQNVRVTYQVQGPIAVLNLGYMVYAFDLVDKKKLWEHNLLGGGGGHVAQNVMRDRDGNLVLVFQDGFVQRIGQAGPVEASYVCVQTRDGLVALDPVKGSVLWTKSGISARTHLFGDDQYIFLVDVNAEGQPSSAARAIRAQDGVAVTVPDFTEPYQRKLRVSGRTILARDETPAGDLVLRLYDVQSGKDLWKKTFPTGSIVLKANDDDFAGAIEPNGTATVFDVRNQKEVLRASLDWKEVLDGRGTSIDKVMEKVSDALLLSDRNQFYIALNKPADNNNAVNGIWPNTYLMRSAPVNGMVYAFDKGTGAPRWAEELSNQTIVLEQFRDLPIVLFTAQYNKRAGNTIVRVQSTKSIHKQSGRFLYDKELTNNGNQFHSIHMDAKAGTIDMVSWNFKIRHELENPPASGGN